MVSNASTKHILRRIRMTTSGSLISEMQTPENKDSFVTFIKEACNDLTSCEYKNIKGIDEIMNAVAEYKNIKNIDESIKKMIDIDNRIKVLIDMP